MRPPPLLSSSPSAGCAPAAPASSPAVVCRRCGLFIGRWTETLPQRGRPGRQTKTHSVSYKNSPTQKICRRLKMCSENVRIGLCTGGAPGGPPNANARFVQQGVGGPGRGVHVLSTHTHRGSHAQCVCVRPHTERVCTGEAPPNQQRAAAPQGPIRDLPSSSPPTSDLTIALITPPALPAHLTRVRSAHAFPALLPSRVPPAHAHPE